MLCQENGFVKTGASGAVDFFEIFLFSHELTRIDANVHEFIFELFMVVLFSFLVFVNTPRHSRFHRECHPSQEGIYG